MEKNEKQQRDEAVKQLAALLGLTPERTETLLGTKVKGTAEFAQTGDFHFHPAQERGPILEHVKRTRNGSTLTRTLKDQSRMRMTVYSEPGSTDPEADLIEEVNQLLKSMKSVNIIKSKGRTILATDSVTIRADSSTASLNVQISVPMPCRDYVTAIANKMGAVFKAISQNKDKLKKYEPKLN